MTKGLVPPVRHPWIAAVGVALAWRLVIYTAAFGLPALSPSSFPGLGAATANALACVVPLAVISWLGWWHAPWLVILRPASWWPLVPLTLLYPWELVFGYEPDTAESLSILAVVLVAAVSEELYARGVVQELLRVVAPIGRAIGVGLIFGLGHILSGVVFGSGLAYLAFQVPHAAIHGFTLAVLRMRVVSIWPLVLLHALSNFMVLTSSPGAVPDWWEGLKLVVILIVGVLFLRTPQREWHSALSS